MQRVWSMEYRGSEAIEVGSALRADLGSPQGGERDAARSARSADPTQFSCWRRGTPSSKGKPETGWLAGG